jgi:DNA-binding helix-hairpin-helix protein with protein kinase domain
MTGSSDGLPDVPSPGDSLQVVRSHTVLTVLSELRRGGEGIIYEVRLGENRFAVKWRWPFEGIELVRDHIDSLIRLRSPHAAFIWPLELVASSDLPGFGYLMPLVDRSRFISASEMILRDASGTDAVTYLRTLLSVGRQIVEAFQSLHGKGLCYRDISLSNILVDPDETEIAIVDNDNVGKADEPTLIRGTRRFMAPEIVRADDGAYPSTATDLYSLATLLFWLFMKRDPLNGIRSEAIASWNAGGTGSDPSGLLQTHGEEPLFIFDPSDPSNRPPAGDVSLAWWQFYPEFLRSLFTRAFTDGLAPSLSGRILEGRWRRALFKVADSVSVCGCRAALVYDPENPSKPCWHCGEIPDPPILMDLPGGSVVLCKGALIATYHLDKRSSDDEAIGGVEIPNDTSLYPLAIRNLSSKTWTIHPDGESSKSVEPGQRVGVRPMTLDFGVGTGRIHSGSGSHY